METSDLKMADPGGGLKFECGICLKEFSTAWCLQMHVKTHDVKRSFECHECGRNFPDLPGLYEHLKTHIFGEESTKEPQELCNICGKEYPRSQISMHKRSHIFKPGLTCKICGKSFGSSQVLKLHLRTHDKKTLYQCQICDLRFASRNSLALHWNCHPNLGSPRPEARSNNSKENARSLNSSSIHTKSFQGHKKVGKKFKCTICSKIFQIFSKVKDHTHVCHSQLNQKDQATPSETCTDRSNSSVTTKDKCTKEIMFSEDAPLFGLMTTVGKYHICTVCKKEFRGKVKAERHARYHFYQHQQKLKQKVPKSGNNMIRHNSDIRRIRQDEQLLHKGHRDIDKALSSDKVVKEGLNCSECGKVFHNTEDLNVHQNIHIKEYAAGLMRMLNPKQSMTLSLEPQNLLQAVHSAENLTRGEDETHKETCIINEVSPENAVPVIALEDTFVENDSLELECVSEDDLNGTFLSDPDIFVSPDSSQSKNTKHKETDQVSFQTSPSNNMSSDLSYEEIMKYILSKDNQIICKICSKQFSNIERISSHVKSHLKKGDHKNYELKDFPDLNKMTSVRVVLERLDLSEFGKPTNTKANKVNNVSTKDAGTNTPAYMYEDIVESEIKSHMNASDTLTPTLGTRSQNEYNKENNLPQADDSDDDVDRFEESAFGSDIADVEWEPSKSIEDCTTRNKSTILSVEFDASDTEGHSDHTNSSAIAAAIAICEDSQIEEHANMASSSLDTKRENSQKQNLKGSSDLAGSHSSDQSSVHTEQSSQSLENPVDITNSSKSKNEEILALFTKKGDLYVCNICSREYECRQKVYSHVTNHLRDRKHKCKFCGGSFDCNALLLDHLLIHEKHHAKYGNISDADVQAIQANYYKQHGIYECKLCDLHFRLAIEAYNHVFHHLFSKLQEGSKVCGDNSLVQSTSEQSYSHDEETFTSSDAVKFIVEENGIYRCLKCQKYLNFLASAKDHVKRHLQGDVYMCTVCPYKTYTRHHLDRHSQTHEKEQKKKFKRRKCSETASNIRRNGISFQCLICSRKFTTKAKTSRHVLIHRKQKPYKCKYCAYSVQYKSGLLKHEKYHERHFKTLGIFDAEDIEVVKDKYVEKDGAFNCNICNQTLKSKSGVHKHILNHMVFEKNRTQDTHLNIDYVNDPEIIDSLAKETIADLVLDETALSALEAEINSSAQGMGINPTEVTKNVCKTPALHTESVPLVLSDGVDQNFDVEVFGDDEDTVVDGDGDDDDEVEEDMDSDYKCGSDSTNSETDAVIHDVADNGSSKTKLVMGNSFQEKELSSKCKDKITHDISKSEDYVDKQRTETCSELHQKRFSDAEQDTAVNKNTPGTSYLNKTCQISDCHDNHVNGGISESTLSHLQRNIIQTGENYACKLCSKKFQRREQCYTHVTHHFRMKKYVCPTCGYATSSKTYLGVHRNTRRCLELQQQISEGKPLDDREQKKAGSHLSEPQSSAHLQENIIKTGETYACKLCCKNFKLRMQCYTHVVHHFRQKKFVCADCGYATSNKTYLGVHRNTRRCLELQQKISEGKPLDDGEQNYALKKKTSGLLNFSQKVSNNEAGSHLLESQSSAHLQENIIKTGETYACKLCSKNFKLRLQCYRHVVYHFRQKKFVCSDCGYATSNRTYLAVHAKIHKKWKTDYPCKVCSRVFSQSKHLTSHIKSHSGEDKIKYLNYLKCEQCSEVFKTLQALYRHKLLHLDTLACKCCDEMFATTEAFENHAYETRHFFCDECGKTFNRLSSLGRHQKRDHNHILNHRMDIEIDSQNHGTISNIGKHVSETDTPDSVEDDKTSRSMEDILISHEDNVSCTEEEDNIQDSVADSQASKSTTDFPQPEQKNNNSPDVFKENITKRLVVFEVGRQCNFKVMNGGSENEDGPEEKDQTVDLEKSVEDDTSSYKLRVRKNGASYTKSVPIELSDDEHDVDEDVSDYDDRDSDYKCDSDSENSETEDGTNDDQLQQQINRVKPFVDEKQNGVRDKNTSRLSNFDKTNQQKILNKEIGAHLSKSKLSSHIQKNIINHEQRVHHGEVLIFQCEESVQTFSTQNELRIHAESHQFGHSCDKCCARFKTFKELKCHQLEMKHGYIFEVRKTGLPCELCGRYFKTDGRLECHRLIHHALEEIGEGQTDGIFFKNFKPSKKLKCPKCRKEFGALQKLANHVRIHVEGKKFQCEICGSAFHQQSYLETHINSHNNVRPFGCKLCFKTFHSKYIMNKHIKNKHQGKLKVHQLVTCDICGKKLSRLSLKNHKLIHDKNTYVKRFPCQQCDKKFYTAAMLKAHLRTHSDEIKVMCDICGKWLRSKYNLQLHRQGHTGEKPFKCDVCGKAFKLKMWLQRHNRIHTGEKPFKCDICDKAFRFQDTLQNHRYIHTGEKPYKCDLCGERFKDRWARHNHIKRHGNFS